MTVDLKTDPTIAVRLDAATARGLQAGGEMILEASNLIAPIEEGPPRHGVHMVETGFVRPETAGADPMVAVGYEAFWAVWQEVKDEYHHAHGQSHFLETAFLTGSEAALARTAETIRAELER
jgi:hypothetical protein